MRSRNDSGTDTMSSRGGGILFIGDGYVVDCVISNNASANRGGAAYHEGSAAWDKAVLLNCRVLNNASAKPCAATMYCTQINCLFKDNVGYDHVGYGCALNCTIFDGVRKSTVSNSYIAAGADRGSNKFGGCHYVTGSTPGDSSVYTGCVDRPAADYVFAPDGMPLKGSPLVDAVADTSFYDATWPTALADYKGKDAIGGARILGGKMDIGAVEYDWVRAPPAGLSVSVDTTGGSNVVSFARTFPSKDAVVKSLTFAGETFEFADVDDDFVYTRTVEGRAQDYGISVAYAKDEWYVDDDGSDDANVGFRKGSPFGTIKKAMGVVSSGGIVHVAPGIYGDRQGLMDVRGGTTNRVVVKAGVGLVADGGPDATAIVGHRSADAGGWGSDAVRIPGRRRLHSGLHDPWRRGLHVERQRQLRRRSVRRFTGELGHCRLCNHEQYGGAWGRRLQIDLHSLPDQGQPGRILVLRHGRVHRGICRLRGRWRNPLYVGPRPELFGLPRSRPAELGHDPRDTRRRPDGQHDPLRRIRAHAALFELRIPRRHVPAAGISGFALQGRSARSRFA